jgi:hypothetical protein
LHASVHDRGGLRGRRPRHECMRIISKNGKCTLSKHERVVTQPVPVFGVINTGTDNHVQDIASCLALGCHAKAQIYAWFLSGCGT